MRHDRFYNFKEKIMKIERKLRTLRGMIFDDFLNLWLPFGTLWLPCGSLWLPFVSSNVKLLQHFCFYSILALSKTTQSIAELCRRHLEAVNLLSLFDRPVAVAS